ncbi:MAG TPA: LuxR family transcriptional regulator, partial [Myxococcota bacterium]|nr:LuxR family transcriptional regulator [Myxococcota bacterium]
MAAISAFIGREAERDWLAERIASHRLVTVVGPGGIGKTRLVAELCGRDGDGFAGVVHHCELAAIGARNEIASEVAGQLGFASLDSLLLGLGDERALLVLDNCEHVLAAAARLCRRLLEATPALHVLATSREPLGIDGEQLLVLGPLALPASSDPADLEAAPATRLFEDRARAAGARREASPEERAAIVELCRRLDGVPLAIELAAARARSLTAVELSAHLDRRFELLQRATPVGQARHRSLRAAIDASYELLDPVEQGFFRALGVFAGPFDAELAHAAVAPPGFDRLDTVDVLARLVDRSLVTAEPQRGITRYGLLDSLRHYAAEQAAAAGEWPAAVGRFVDAMVAQADSIVAAGSQRWTSEVLELVFAQLGNLVAAIERCVESDAAAGRSFRLLLPLWGAVHQGRASVVAEVCERVLARWPEGDEPLRAEALAVAASASLPAGRVERAGKLAERALRSPSSS